MKIIKSLLICIVAINSQKKQEMNILEANKNKCSIICKDVTERNVVVNLLHGFKITHITTGEKKYSDYQQRVKRNIYTDQQLVISLYGGDFFAILETASKNFPIIDANDFILPGMLVWQ